MAGKGETLISGLFCSCISGAPCIHLYLLEQLYGSSSSYYNSTVPLTCQGSISAATVCLIYNLFQLFDIQVGLNKLPLAAVAYSIALCSSLLHYECNQRKNSLTQLYPTDPSSDTYLQDMFLCLIDHCRQIALF